MRRKRQVAFLKSSKVSGCEALGSLNQWFFHGKVFTRLLERCGIEPRRYWLLVDLFETLGKRQEVVRMGDQGHSMRSVLVVWCILSSIISLVMAVLGVSPEFYLLVFVGLTVFQLGLLLISEVAESLVNPVEGLILAHQPVNGATWSGAKLTHLIKVVVYIVAGVNGVPALVGFFLPHTNRFFSLVYPPMHFLIALGVGLVVALLCCSLFGWLVRFVPVRRLKAAAAMVQVVPILFGFGFQFLNTLREDLVSWATSIELPEGWLAVVDAAPGGFPVMLGVVFLAVATVAVLFGLRALSGDHLIRVSGLMHSGSRVRRREWRRWKVGAWISRFAGGQASRAGFEYLRSMMIRDWQFRRIMAMHIPMVIFGFIFVLVSGWEVSPFAPGFASTHFLPHLVGVTIFITCRCLVYGNDYKGIGWFFIVPDSSFRPFVRGIHAALWLMLIVVPNVFCLFVLAWSWGLRDAVVFIAYSTVVASLCLGVGLRLIDGVPFGKQMEPTKNIFTFGLTLIYFVVVSIAVGVQYLLFRSVVAVAAVTLVVGFGAYFLTRLALANFESRIRSHLDLAASGSMFLYKEVE